MAVAVAKEGQIVMDAADTYVEVGANKEIDSIYCPVTATGNLIKTTGGHIVIATPTAGTHRINGCVTTSGGLTNNTNQTLIIRVK